MRPATDAARDAIPAIGQQPSVTRSSACFTLNEVFHMVGSFGRRYPRAPPPFVAHGDSDTIPSSATEEQDLTRILRGLLTAIQRTEEFAQGVHKCIQQLCAFGSSELSQFVCVMLKKFRVLLSAQNCICAYVPKNTFRSYFPKMRIPPCYGTGLDQLRRHWLSPF